jgi:hypothetical protein
MYDAQQTPGGALEAQVLLLLEKQKELRAREERPLSGRMSVWGLGIDVLKRCST